MARVDGKSVQPSPGYQAVRSGVFEFTRATEQITIVTSQALGCDLDESMLRPISVPWIMGSLQRSYCRPSILYLDPQDREIRDPHERKGRNRRARRKDWGRFKFPDFRCTPIGLQDPGNNGDQLDLDLIIAPLDGVNALSTGRSGTISAIAGGKPGFFAKHLTDDSMSEWFVIVVRKGAADTLKKSIKNTKLSEGDDLAEVMRKGRWFRALDRYFRRSQIQPTIGLTFEGPYRNVHRQGLLPDEFSRRTCLEGSTVAAAITALLRRDGIYVAAMCSRRTHTFLIATAVASRRGHMLAIPIRRERKGPSTRLVCASDRILDHLDFVAQDNMNGFFVATGVTASRVLDGVVFRDEGEVRTHSLCLSCRTSATRFLRHAFFLDGSWFQRAVGHNPVQDVPSKQAIRNVQDEFRMCRANTRRRRATRARAGKANKSA